MAGVRVVEFDALGPAPFAAMLLADMGAAVVRLRRPDRRELLDSSGPDPVRRGRVATLTVDLKTTAGVHDALTLLESADALLEGMRPGVMERLGLAPDAVWARNPRLVYGRMTGYGQDGPLAQTPGHDVNYLSIAGALGAFAREGERPLFPLNLVADYGGGGVLFAFGVVCGILESRLSGRGQVVDASMVDGVALLTTAFHGLRARGAWSDVPGRNVLDSGAHFYEVYETADGAHLAVGAIEPQFYAELLATLEINVADMPQWDRGRWPAYKVAIAERFRSRTSAEWLARFGTGSACVTPVLSLGDAPDHPHNVARGTFTMVDGVRQPGPAPRFGRTVPRAAPAGPELALAEWIRGAR